MLQAILLDLDNTLVLYDESRFYDGYFKRLAGCFADVVPPDAFTAKLVEATLVLLQNDGRTTNAACFMEAFTAEFPDRREELWERFLEFYATEYDQLDRTVDRPPDLERVFAWLASSPLKRVLASNPIFPLTAQLKRFAWAGLGTVAFDVVTHIENMSFCKPHVEYFLTISRMLDLPPEACLMVGNDPVQDMNAARAGMKTYLTTDLRTHRFAAAVDNPAAARVADGRVPGPDFEGPLAGVIAAVQQLSSRRAS